MNIGIKVFNVYWRMVFQDLEKVHLFVIAGHVKKSWLMLLITITLGLFLGPSLLSWDERTWHFSEINFKVHWTLQLYSCTYLSTISSNQTGGESSSHEIRCMNTNLWSYKNRVSLLLITSWLRKKRISIAFANTLLFCLYFVICLISCFVLINFPCYSSFVFLKKKITMFSRLYFIRQKVGLDVAFFIFWSSFPTICLE